MIIKQLDAIEQTGVSHNASIKKRVMGPARNNLDF